MTDDPRRPLEGLSVRPSRSAPPDVNPHLRPVEASTPDPAALFDAMVAGDRVALGRALTLVENRGPSHRDAALALLDRCSERVRTLPPTRRIGISGSPGVGKSTFIDGFGVRLVDEGRRVAVLAVDPSSDRTGGSILGDKTRMAGLVAREAAFIRPSPSAGALGGVARRTRAAMLCCEAAGYDHVLVETVGVGQSETAVRRMADTFVLLAQAGSGDELQGIKRGIVEVADLIVVTKADGELRHAAESASSALRAALSLWPPDESGWRAPVLTVSALESLGWQGFEEAMARHAAHLAAEGRFDRNRTEQALSWMREELDGYVADRIEADGALARRRHSLEADVRSGSLAPHRAAATLADGLWT